MRHGRRKSLSFRFHEIATQTRNDKVLGVRPKRKPIRSVLINGMCDFEDGIGAARRRPYRASDLRHTQAHFATITTSCNRLPFGLCVPFPTRQKLRFHLSYSHSSSLVLTCGSPCVCSTSDCAILLRSRRTKRSGTMREMALVMSRP